MNQTERQAVIYRQIRELVDRHDAPGGCPGNEPAKGVRTSYADIERLGWEEGDVVYPSKNIKIYAGGQFGSLRVICDAEKSHNNPGVTADEDVPASNEESINADAEPARKEGIEQRELVTV